MKKIFAMTLAVLVLSTLCACGGESQPTVTTTAPATTVPTTAPTTVPTTAPTTVPTTAPTEAPEADPQLGSYENGVFTNEFLGIQWVGNEQWTVYSKEEMAQINGIVADYMTDEALAEQLKNSGVAYAFYAMADEGLVTINVALENLGLIYGTVLTESSYVERSVDQIPAALGSMGLENITVETATVQFAGAEHAGVNIHGTLSGVDFYEQLVCIKVGSYMAIVTVASYYEDITTDLLGMFTAV